MWALILRTIKNHQTAFIAYGLINLSFLWMFVGLFPSLADQADELNQLLASYPSEFIAAIGVEDISVALSSIEGFLAMEQFSMTWPLMMIVFAISIAGSAVAGEVERGTIELVLSNPVSRTKVLVSKIIAGIILITGFCFVSIFGIVPLLEIYSVPYDINHFVVVYGLCLLFGICVYSVAVLFSTVASEKAKVGMGVTILMALMYAINVATKLQENIENLKYFSLFHYFDPDAALLRSEIDGASILVFSVVAVLALAASIVWFNKRDLTV